MCAIAGFQALAAAEEVVLGHVRMTRRTVMVIESCLKDEEAWEGESAVVLKVQHAAVELQQVALLQRHRVGWLGSPRCSTSTALVLVTRKTAHALDAPTSQNSAQPTK